MVKAGDVVFDLGANIGEVTLNMAKIVGEKGKVVAFEPYFATYEKLRHNCELNAFDNITLIQKALGAGKSLVQMVQVNEHNSGMNRIVPPGNDNLSTVAIETTSLDELVVTHKIAKVDLIKIDVEGFEIQVLSGARESLRKFRPKLFKEISDDNLKVHQSSDRELLDFLADFGYSTLDAGAA